MDKSVDVLIVGGGPSGLLTAYALLKFGLSVLVIEKDDKSPNALYGRACVLHGRTLELLDGLGLFEGLAEIGSIMRDSSTYHNGEKVEGRGWTFVRDALEGNTFFTYSMGIRQKYSEDVFRKHIRAIDANAIQAPAVALDFVEDQSSDSEYPTTATIEANGKQFKVKCKFIIGADGSRSTMRKLANIEMLGISTPQRWVRMDGVVETDIPNSTLGAVAIESPEHGNILWLPIDHGRVRIGYALPQNLSEAYDRGEPITGEIAMQEAIKTVAPFSLKFKQLDWYTVYSISQRVAEQYRKGTVILVGDACHTHSSGSAQGMNTGVHDAVNLGWKLGGYMAGLYTEAVLNSYETERQAIAHDLIELDKVTSYLIGGKIPESLKEQVGPNADVNEVLNQTFRKNAAFTVGLGISYKPNLLNRHFSVDILNNVNPGERVPDTLVYPAGRTTSKPLYDIIRNNGKFWVAVLLGHVESLPHDSIRKLRDDLANHTSFISTLNSNAFEFITITSGSLIDPIGPIGGDSFGSLYYDMFGDFYTKLGVDATKGAILVIRPDTHLGSAFSLTDAAGIKDYFSEIVTPSQTSKTNGNLVTDIQEANEITVGEISVENKPETTLITST